MQVPPHSREHEYALVSCCMHEPMYCGREALDTFGDECPFYTPECALVWSAFQRVDLDKIAVLTVSDFLGDRLDLTKIRELANTEASIAHFKTHLDWVRKHHAQRNIIGRLSVALNALYDPKAKPDEIVQEIRDGVGKAICEGHRVSTVGDALDGLVSMHQNQALGSSTGYKALDKVLYPIPPGSMVVVAARPKIGKTALAMGMALNLAMHGTPVGIVSMEMPKEQLAARMLASTACVSSRPQDLQYTIGGEDCTKAMDVLKQLPIYIEDGLHDWNKIKRAIRTLSNQHGINHWWIDHIGLVRHSGGTHNREREVAEISGDCKQMALEMRGWFFVLSQLNRQAEGVMPQLHHLRESGSIEQDADAVVFLHTERNDTHEKFVHIQSGGHIDVTAMVAAHRHGPTGPVQMRFFPKFSLFSND